MTDPESFDRPKSKVLLISFVVGIVAVLLFGLGYLFWPSASNNESNPQTTGTSNSADTSASSDGNSDVNEPSQPAPIGGGDVLPRAMSGQEAIDALGDNIDRVADQNHLTVKELKEKLLQDATLHVSKSGRLVFLDTGLSQTAQ